MIQSMLQYVRLCLVVCRLHSLLTVGGERSGKMLSAGCISSKCVHMRESSSNKWLYLEVIYFFVVEFAFFVISFCASFGLKRSLKKHAKQYSYEEKIKIKENSN